ncbi:hypothetical protein MNEG_7398 [Monoraphidium neglectum]|uniref:Auxin efflux carrier n=1 Tax=Monoraphidium neglectum TaxID=145388 RepID=A0A0D2N358_9CHLO|nr:hypothetical protein MNEG_7398 [Monoraphidium neglectum]KIZ00566.1 hypothetical protein MNEG_7398 [Monoraphidium neglectum]|eukprot:XP_013899585.1 hypothetical protein MNEG_7398 [Monoraphidium neglectum]
MIDYVNIMLTGVQSLLALAAGWACARWRALDSEPAVQQLNLFVLRVCIPALQVWLLAVKTDMRRKENWSVLCAFLSWSLGLQLLCAAGQLAARRRIDRARLAVESLVLTTNNTGILGPVVLEAALGPRYAPLGMLATVVLYFQQLPSAAVLFDAAQRAQKSEEHELLLPSVKAGAEAEGGAGRRRGGGALAGARGRGPHDIVVCSGGGGVHSSTAASTAPAAAPTAATAAALAAATVAAAAPQSGTADRGERGPVAAAAVAAAPGGGGALLMMARNPMVWSTAAALLLSCLGSAVILEPTSPRHLRALGFVEPLLRWFAGCTAPVTLFCTGLWAEGQEAAKGPGQRELTTFLVLRATLAPALMALIARLSGFHGDMAVALVILSILPVAQTAFVICKQYETGTHAITAAMVASLLLMLPQLVGTLALLERWGAFL